MIGVKISNQSDKPIYQQLFEQISAMILNRVLESDFSLPSIRTAAKELRVSVITVKAAWEELERSGLIYTVAGKGCFISEFSDDELSLKRDEIINKQLDKDLVFYRNMGADKQELISLIEKKL